MSRRLNACSMRGGLFVHSWDSESGESCVAETVVTHGNSILGGRAHPGPRLSRLHLTSFLTRGVTTTAEASSLVICWTPSTFLCPRDELRWRQCCGPRWSARRSCRPCRDPTANHDRWSPLSAIACGQCALGGGNVLARGGPAPVKTVKAKFRHAAAHSALAQQRFDNQLSALSLPR